MHNMAHSIIIYHKKLHINHSYLRYGVHIDMTRDKDQIIPYSIGGRTNS